MNTGAHLLTETHVELVLDTVAASCDFVPDAFCMALVERLDKVCAVFRDEDGQRRVR